jgi:hypothetical protein
MVNTHYATIAPLNAKLSETSATAKFALGTKVIGDGGTEWVYVQASGAITQYDLVSIDTAYTATTCTAALANGSLPGFAQIAFATTEYGWVAIKGTGISARVAASTSNNAQLTIGSSGVSAGVMASTSGTGAVKVNGVVTTSSNTASGTAAKNIIATNPFFFVA